MSQPTEKRADQLKIGDHIHDGRGIGPVEITHVQPHTNAHGDARILLVTDDAAASWHPADEVFALGTQAEVADAKMRRDRVMAIAHIRALADWYEQHTDVPAPVAVDVRVSIEGKQPDNAAKREAIREIAAAMGVEVVERNRTVGATYVVADYNPARVEVKATLWLDDEPEPAPLDATLDPETPLDELPDDFGADHQPEPDCCEDCDAKLDEADAIFGAEMDAEAADDGQHLAYNAATDRHETGGDEIEFADEGDES